MSGDDCLIRAYLYNTSWSTFGGGEKYICRLADVLSKLPRYDVTLLVDKAFITKEQLRKYFDIALEGVTLEIVQRRTVTKILDSADLGIIMSNFRSFGNHAKRNVYVLQIPYPQINFTSLVLKAIRENPKESLKDLMRLSLLRDARKANLVLVYSTFVQQVLREHHRVDGQVLHPPIDDFYTGTQKRDVVLSVGRFFSGLYNDKRFDVLIEAFKRLSTHPAAKPWEYRLVGSCGKDPSSQRYLASLKEVARGYPIYFHVNTSYDELRRQYNEAKIFWHAAGYGVDEAKHPERMEHFGMSTVEAMSARCLPIVINKGGQKEIVFHGESGYLWNTVDELIDVTLKMMTNAGLRAKLQ